MRADRKRSIEMNRIAVIGTGYVGLVTGVCYADKGNRVICCDIDQGKIERLNRGESPIYEPGIDSLLQSNLAAGRLTFTTDIPSAIQESDVIFVAVGTPMSETGEADLTYVRSAARMIGESLNGYKVVVIKSTVPVGTGKMVKQLILETTEHDFDMVSNPEFLREGSAIDDCMNMERAIIGAENASAAKVVENLHEPFQTTVLMTDIETAELIKYAANAFLATKISFINNIANLCELVGADIDKLSRGIGLDSRIGLKYLQAGIGYGGSCFPKDTQALVHISRTNGYEFSLLESVIETNEKQQLVVIDKLLRELPDLAGKEIAVLGLAFKPGTDDMRHAPSLKVIPELVRKGARVRGYDPVAVTAAKMHFGDFIDYFVDLNAAINGADACIIMTEWPEIAQMELTDTKRLLKQPIMIDGRNCFDPKTMRALGFAYHSIGRKPVLAGTPTTLV